MKPEPKKTLPKVPAAIMDGLFTTAVVRPGALEGEIRNSLPDLNGEDFDVLEEYIRQTAAGGIREKARQEYPVLHQVEDELIDRVTAWHGPDCRAWNIQHLMWAQGLRTLSRIADSLQLMGGAAQAKPSLN